MDFIHFDCYANLVCFIDKLEVFYSCYHFKGIGLIYCYSRAAELWAESDFFIYLKN